MKIFPSSVQLCSQGAERGGGWCRGDGEAEEGGGERQSGVLECYCGVMINVSLIFLFILTDESSDESCSSALLLLVQHKTHLSEGTH